MYVAGAVVPVTSVHIWPKSRPLNFAAEYALETTYLLVRQVFFIAMIDSFPAE